MSTPPEDSDPIDKIHAAHPGWRISYDAGTWYARGPWLENNLVQATSAEDLDHQLTEQEWR